MTPARVRDLLLGAIAVLAVLPTLSVTFAGGGTPALVIAAAGPALLALASLALPFASPSAVGAAWSRLAADVVLVVVVLALIGPDADGRRALAGLPSGGARLLTGAAPLQATGPELGIAVLAVAVAAVVTAEITLRTRRTLAPLGPILVLLVAALLVAAGGRPTPLWNAPVVVAASGALAVGRVRRSPAPPASGAAPNGPTVGGQSGEVPARSPLNPLVVGYATVAVVALVLIPLAGHLPGSHARRPYDLRAAVTPPSTPVVQTSPLATWASIYDAPVRPELTATVRGPASVTGGLIWQLGVFDDFDGFEWASTGAYRQAGTQLPPGPKLGVATARVTARVSLLAPQSAVPVPDRPTGISSGGLDLSSGGGVLLVPPGRPAPSTYTVTSSVPDPSASDLLGASLPDTGGAEAASVPPAVASLAQSAVSTAEGTPFAKIKALRSYLTTAPFTRTPPGKTPIADGDAAVTELLTDTHNGGALQYASAFALLARSVGFQSRLVLGYDGGQAHPVAGGSGGEEITYTNRNLDVVPEVLLSGIGWYPIPLSQATGTASSVPSPDSSTLSKALQQQATPSNASPPPTHHQPPAPRPRPQPGSSVVLPLVVAVLAALLVLIAIVLGLKAARARRQRRSPDPITQVAGAWDNILDRLVEIGVDLDDTLTTQDVVDRVATHFDRPAGTRSAPVDGAGAGGPQASAVATLIPIVDRSRYDQRFPPTTAEADAVWSAAGEAARALRRGRPWPNRLLARLSLAPLRRG